MKLKVFNEIVGWVLTKSNLNNKEVVFDEIAFFRDKKDAEKALKYFKKSEPNSVFAVHQDNLLIADSQ